MFEKYQDLPSQPRSAKNIELLKKYQEDIDKLSGIFSEDDLFDLCTSINNRGDVRMKSVKSFNPLGSAVLDANQINLFQDVALLKQWIKQQKDEYKLLNIKIYAPISRQNKVPSTELTTIDNFIKKQKNDRKSLINFYLKLLAVELMNLKNIDNYKFETSTDGRLVYKGFLKNYGSRIRLIRKHLNSTEWISSLPVIVNLTPIQVSSLVLSRFFENYYFNIIELNLEKCEGDDIFHNGFMYHENMIPFITLSLIPFGVMSPIVIKNRYDFSLKTPDEFLIRNLINSGRNNLTGYKKDISQLLLKTYIYIALLIHPEWSPSAKEILRFIEGKDQSLHGELSIQTTSRDLRSKINNITKLSSEIYIAKLIKLMMKSAELS